MSIADMEKIKLTIVIKKIYLAIRVKQVYVLNNDRF